MTTLQSDLSFSRATQTTTAQHREKRGAKNTLGWGDKGLLCGSKAQLSNQEPQSLKQKLKSGHNNHFGNCWS